jgi:glycerophosphoryl diester phosphodiesterase
MFISFTFLIIKLILILNGSGFSHQTSSFTRWSWDPDDIGPDGLPRGRPLILGHRGSSGMYPEHTLISYTEGAKQGADIIECDMVLTKVSGQGRIKLIRIQ